MKLHFKLLRNDFRKRTWKNLILSLFMCLSVTIAAAVVLMLCQLFSSISTMYETAKPAHFLQMHMGSIRQEDIDDFNENFEGVTAWQSVPMMTIYGEQILVTGQSSSYTLEDCRLDISFVKQNEEYDVLLDENRVPLELEDGAVAVPMIVLDQYDISLGDKITLRDKGIEKEFTVTDYVYDGMMNSTTCSSTRFLISEGDFDALFGKIGETEYLIETYFADRSMASAYQSAYEQSEKDLPKNGQAITYTVIFLLSALTDILTAMVFVLAGALLLLVVMMCLRYIILGELEDDVKEIGTMKSIGIPDKGIKKLYLTKVEILMGLSCVVGFLLALLLLPKLTGHIRRFFGVQALAPESILLAVAAVGAIVALILLFTKKILKQIDKKTIVDLMVLDQGFGKESEVKSRIYRRRYLSANASIGLQEAKRGYGIVFVLMLLVSFLVMVPVRSLQTMEAEEFVTYMGSPLCDILVEVMQGQDLEDRNRVFTDTIDKERENGHVQQISAWKRVRLQALSQSSELVGLHIDTGLSSGQGIAYLQGSAPYEENRIALSYLLAEELGKTIGDTVSILGEEQSYCMVVCGIYQDVTSGGKTAKSSYDFPAEVAEKYTYQINLSKEYSVESFTESLRNDFRRGYSIKDMDDFLDQTLGGVTGRFHQAVSLIMLIGFLITIFIVLLFMELRLARSHRPLTEKLSMGISLKDICIQELYPVLLTGVAGVISGMILTELLGELLVSALFSLLGLGITSISFSNMPLGCLAIPLSLIGILAVITLGVCTKIKRIDMVAYFNQ